MEIFGPMSASHTFPQKHVGDPWLETVVIRLRCIIKCHISNVFCWRQHIPLNETTLCISIRVVVDVRQCPVK